MVGKYCHTLEKRYISGGGKKRRKVVPVLDIASISKGHTFNTLEGMHWKCKKKARDLKEQQLVLAFDLFNSLIKRVIPASSCY